MDARNREILQSAISFLDTACETWRELILHWEHAGNQEKAQYAREELERCEGRRRRALNLLNEI